MNISQRSKYLRQKLDKINISYETDDSFNEKLTAWKQDESIFYYRETEYRDKFVISKATPEQAIAATFMSSPQTDNIGGNYG